MSVFTAAYPDGRVGREARNLFTERFGYVPDIENRNRLQDEEAYRFMITKARDVPRAVEMGCDFGLTGRDFLEEYGNRDLEIIEELPACRSRVVLFERKEGGIIPVPVTVYPNISRKYLGQRMQNNDCWTIVNLNGETESWVASGMADFGIDVVETSKTLQASGLAVNEVIMESSAVIIARKDNIDKVRGLYV